MADLDATQNTPRREGMDRDSGERRIELLRQARGIWADRDDLLDFRAIRSELDRVGGRG
ncbi:MAG: hypothetical protein ACE5NC_10505 [Anaerolineae bacterium]